MPENDFALGLLFALRDLGVSEPRLDELEAAIDARVGADMGRGRARSGRGGRRLGLLLTACGVLVSVVLALGALVLVGGHRGGQAAAPAPVPAPARALVAELGVLRRPQTAADRAADSSPLLRYRKGRGRAIPSLTRLARVLPGGIRLFLYVMPPQRGVPGGAELGQATIDPGGEGTGGGGATAAELRQPSLGPVHAGADFAGQKTAVYYELVPDGVARVRWTFPRQPSTPEAGGVIPPVFAKPLNVEVAVHDNVAAMKLPDHGFSPAATTWYALDGRVLARHGLGKALDRVIRPPRPGPQTTLSRRAERNPATPNPLHVTPNRGSRDTAFDVRFHVLLNGGLYHFVVSGGPHAGCAPSYAGDDYGGSYLRGQTFTIKISAGTRGWCTGAYRITAAYVVGPGAKPHRPFGTARFTVR